MSFVQNFAGLTSFPEPKCSPGNLNAKGNSSASQPTDCANQFNGCSKKCPSQIIAVASIPIADVIAIKYSTPIFVHHNTYETLADRNGFRVAETIVLNSSAPSGA